jgi:hypothetical protein
MLRDSTRFNKIYHIDDWNVESLEKNLEDPGKN